MEYTRKNISQFIVSRLMIQKEHLIKQYNSTKKNIGYFFVDDLLPEELVLKIHARFPEIRNTIQRKSLREFKHTAYQMNLYEKILEEVIYAFQEREVVKLIEEICGLTLVFPDKHLYAGGLSLMGKDNFLNPHLDNSHDKERNRWRVFNLLFYVTPNWQIENGGNLELWTNGIKEKPITIVSKFNRLVVMATHQNSWHSVSKVKVTEVRCCISNYYFSNNSLSDSDKFHVTTFRGRSTEKVKDVLLLIDNSLRTSLRRLFKRGVRENPHQYKR